MKKIVFWIIPSLIFLMSCEESNEIEGLWGIKSVSVGEEDMTPNGRWIRFNTDGTQTSGNGWVQHTIGAWEMDGNDLSITNTNGVEDVNAPFSVTVSGDSMSWERTEEGELVVVHLAQISELPTTYSDQLLGLWGVEKAVGNGPYFEPSEIPKKDYLFFRWDRRFLVGTEMGQIRGVYNVNGHRPEVDLIPSHPEQERTSWGIDFYENEITLSLLDSDSSVTRFFKRIYTFPE